ncbi:MAG: SUMF1/EgtB/PvdO family nonheme iron enzyme [Vicinamibacterales bacterium]
MSLDRAAVLDRFQRARARTRALFEILEDGAYDLRPIASWNHVAFYEGHLPAFAVTALLGKGLGEPGIDADLDARFASGISPDEDTPTAEDGRPTWPGRAIVRQYADEAERRICDAIAHADFGREDRLLARQALWTILDYEEAHHESLACLWHQLPYVVKRKPVHYVTAPPRLRTGAAPLTRVRVPAGRATLGTRLRQGLGGQVLTPLHPSATYHLRPTIPCAWDNELPAHTVDVGAFEVDVHNVTNARFMDFVESGGYADPRWWSDADRAWMLAERVSHPAFWIFEDGSWHWRGMFEQVPLPEHWPVYLTWAEAHAYARWRGQRLFTEAEFHRSAYGTPRPGEEREYPWGDELPRRLPSNLDFTRWDPDPVDAHPSGVSAFGVHDLVGNGWEWTGDLSAPLEGCAPMALMKGASPATSRGLVRRGFRHWCPPRFPHVYATFRCVGPA